MGAATGVTLLRLNAGRAAIGKLPPPPRRNAFSGCMYQARSISAAQRGGNGDGLQYSYKLLQVCASACVSDPLSGRGSPSHFL